MINTQHDKWWRVLFDSGLLDRLDSADLDSGAKESATVRTLRVPHRTSGGSQAAYSDLKFIPRVLLSKFLHLLDEIEAGRRSNNSMEALASFYVVGIATPIVSELAEFCRTYTYNTDPTKEETLKYMIEHLRKYVIDLQEKMQPYPYLNETKWQLSMQDDFRFITTNEPTHKKKVPDGYPCIVRCRKSATGYSVKTAYILVNGAALAFTVPWIHSASELPRNFSIRGMKDGYGLFGILSVSAEDLAEIYKIGLTPMEEVFENDPRFLELKANQRAFTKQRSKFLTSKLETAKKIVADPKSVKGVTQKIIDAATRYVNAYDELEAQTKANTTALRQLKSDMKKESPHSRLRFYALDILICKVLTDEVTRPVIAPYQKVEKLLEEYRPDLPLTSKLEFINQPRGRRWKLTVD
jgi:hypothetical protein